MNVVLDASVLIAYLDRRDAHHGPARSLLESEADSQFGISPVTLAEVLVGPLRLGRGGEVRAAMLALGVIELPFLPDLATSLAKLRISSGLRMPNCFVLLAAIDSKASLASFDDRLRTVAAGYDVPALPQQERSPITAPLDRGRTTGRAIALPPAPPP